MLRYLGTIVATAIVVLFLLVSAIPLLHWFREEGRTGVLEENRTLWQELGLVDYRMVLDARSGADGWPSGPLRIRVRNDRPVGIERASGGDALLLPAGGNYPATVERLFDLVLAWIENAPAVLDVTYDENYGFPREIHVDADPDTENDEIDIVVTGFDPRVGDEA